MIKNNDYLFHILDRLLKKYHKKILHYGYGNHARRVDLKITEVFRNYDKPSADTGIKAQINESALALKAMGFVCLKHLPFSDDIIKIYLNEDAVKEIEIYMEKQFGVPARCDIVNEMQGLLHRYEGGGALTDYYCGKLKYGIEHSVLPIDMDKEREILKILAFIQENEEDLYVREVSMLVYGSSKYFEENRYDAVCGIIREATGQPVNENEKTDEILQQYHISNVEQEISIKGDFLIEIEGYRLETKYLSGGLSLSSRDIGKIDKITVRTKYLMTVENKTSYYRYEKQDDSLLYLGGFANRHQIEFLKKICSDNRACKFRHFGDIDIGGFFIHQHLCNATGIDFSTFHMGKEELNDSRYRHSLMELTANDAARAEKLSGKPDYREVLAEMLDKGIKLEQEIISYVLMQK